MSPLILRFEARLIRFPAEENFKNDKFMQRGKFFCRFAQYDSIFYIESGFFVQRTQTVNALAELAEEGRS